MTQDAQAASERTAIRSFSVSVPQAELNELRRRINATNWPDRETVADYSQGVPLAMIQGLATYWKTDHDWRKCEAKLNALPQFMTEIDGPTTAGWDPARIARLGRADEATWIHTICGARR